MNWKLVIGGLLVIALVAIGAGGALYTGLGPAPGGTDSGDQLTDFPTATSTATSPSDGSDSSGDTAPAPTTPPFSFAIDRIEECGTTCRDVTATLHNNQDEAATGVTVFTRVYAGQDNTADDDLVWEGKQDVGTLEAGAEFTTTRRVELSFQEGLQIQNQDGWITIVTTVQSDQRTVTFTDSEQAA